MFTDPSGLSDERKDTPLRDATIKGREAINPTLIDGINAFFDGVKQTANNGVANGMEAVGVVTYGSLAFGQAVSDTSHAAALAIAAPTLGPADDVLVAYSYSQSCLSFMEARLEASVGLAIAEEFTKAMAGDAVDAARFVALGKVTEDTGSSKRLTDAVQESGRQKPENWEAHHIAPQGMRFGLRGALAQFSRGVLAYYEVPLDDAANGVFLPRNKNDNSGASHHGSGHTTKNLAELAFNLFNAHTSGAGAAGVKEVLERFGREYTEGRR